MFHVPAMFDEVQSQGIQQLGIIRSLALSAEIFLSPTKSSPKEQRPGRFTKTRAVNLPTPRSESTNQFARSRRFARRDTSSFPRKAGTAGSTTGPLSSSQLPRGRTRTVRGFSICCATMTACFCFWPRPIVLSTVQASGAKLHQ